MLKFRRAGGPPVVVTDGLRASGECRDSADRCVLVGDVEVGDPSCSFLIEAGWSKASLASVSRPLLEDAVASPSSSLMRLPDVSSVVASGKALRLVVA
jgi:hypothetical protein